MIRALYRMSNIEILGKSNFPKERITQEILELIHRRLEYIAIETENLTKELNNFQSIYHKSNEEFLEDFTTGKIGDEQDFFIWKSSLKILKDLTEEEKMLKDLL